MSQSADEVFENGQQAQVPLLAGWNSQESSPMSTFRGLEPTLENYKKILSARFGDMTDEIFEAYGLLTDDDLFSQKGMNLASDLFTGYPTWKWCDYHSRTDNAVYRYKYMHPRPKPSDKMGDQVAGLAGGVRPKTEADRKEEAQKRKMPQGATHSSDIEYAMGNLKTNVFYEWTEEDYAISRIFLSYYANFCKTGNPNGEGLPVWTAMNGQNIAPVMQIDVETI